jgi:hypothetical protein
MAGFLPNLALALSAAVTVFSAYETFFAPRSLWIQETTSLAQLRDLQRSLAFQKAGSPSGQPSPDAICAVKDNLDRILDNSLKAWLSLRGAEGSRAAPPNQA